MKNKKFICLYCGREFVGNLGLVSHLTVCKNNLNREIFICLFCGKEYSKNGLTNHLPYCNKNPNKINKVRRDDYPKTICEKCGREIVNNAFRRHYNICNGVVKIRYSVDHEDLSCKFCGKECKNKNSLCLHEIRCKDNPNKIKTANNGTNAMHEKLILYGNWNEGQTKETNESIKLAAETYKKHYAEGIVSKTTGKASTVEKEIERRNKISNTVQSNILNNNWHINDHTRYFKSFIKINDNVYLLRSSYELIYAYYLAINKILFEVETIRVRAVDSPYNKKIFVSDFYIPVENKIVETKGWETDKDNYEKLSFEEAGYKFLLINSDGINEIKSELSNSIDILAILEDLKNNLVDKNYKTFDLTAFYD